MKFRFPAQEGRLTVTVTVNGYHPQIIESITVQDGGAAVRDVRLQLDPSEGGFGYKVVFSGGGAGILIPRILLATPETAGRFGVDVVRGDCQKSHRSRVDGSLRANTGD